MKKLLMPALALLVVLPSAVRADTLTSAAEVSQAKDSQGNDALKVGSKMRYHMEQSRPEGSLGRASIESGIQVVRTNQGPEGGAPYASSELSLGMNIDAEGELLLSRKDFKKKGFAAYYAPISFEGKANLVLAGAPSDQINGRISTSAGVTYTNDAGEIAILGPVLSQDWGESSYGKTNGTGIGGRVNLIGQRGYLNVTVVRPVRGKFDGGHCGSRGKIELGGKVADDFTVGAEVELREISNRELKLDGTPAEDVNSVETKVFAGLAF